MILLTARERAGRYSYFIHGTESRCFPDYLDGDIGGKSGWIPFANGALMEGRETEHWINGLDVLWNIKTCAGGIDIVFDLDGIYNVRKIVLTPLYITSFSKIEIHAKEKNEDVFKRVVAYQPVPTAPIFQPVTLEGFDVNCRFMKICLIPRQSVMLALRKLEIWGDSLPLKINKPEPAIFPIPKDISFGKGKIGLRNKAFIAVAKNASRETIFAANELKEYAGENWELKLQITRANVRPAELLLVDDRRQLQNAVNDASVRDMGTEGYEIKIDKNGVYCRAQTEAGLFYAVQTIMQMGQHENGKVFFPFGVIKDSPAKPIRGTHVLVPAQKEIAFFKKWIREVLARSKYNVIFMEIGGGVEYKRHPEINAKWREFSAYVRKMKRDSGAAARISTGCLLQKRQNCTHWELGGGSFITQKQMKDLIEYARAYHIEIIPEIQSLTHCYYLVSAHPEIASDPDTAYPGNYCPSNPRSYKLLFEVMDELISVFHPRFVHIGHDEWEEPCYCEKCRKKSAAELFGADVTRIHDFLAKRNIRTMIWADQVLLSGRAAGTHATCFEANDYHFFRNTYGAIDKIPKDTILLNWYWTLPKHNEYIREKGFQYIIGNFMPQYDDWDKCAADPLCLGAEISTWVGVSSYEYSLHNPPLSFLASADVFWTGRSPAKIDVEPRLEAVAGKVRKIMLGEMPSLSLKKKTYYPIRINKYFNSPLFDTTGVKGDWDMTGLPAGLKKAEGIPFALPTAAPFAKRAVVVESRRVENKLFNVQSPAMPVGKKLDGLVFLHAATQEGKNSSTSQRFDFNAHAGEELGRYVIKFADNSEKYYPLYYGENIKCGPRKSLLDDQEIYCRAVFTGFNPRGGQYAAYAAEWINPVPGKTIRSIILQGPSHPTAAGVILLAITGIRLG